MKINPKDEFAILLGLLSADKVTKVIVRYEGGGDSGEVSDIEFYSGEKEIEGNLHKKLHTKVYKEFETMTYKLLETYVGDWYNDSGGYGKVEIGVPGGDFTIDSHIRIEQTEDSSYDGSLKNEDGWPTQ